MTGSAKKQPIPFGKYLLLDRVNIGGMAEVWRGKAFAPGGFERLVAIKRILPNIAEDDEFVAMFIDEAKICVQLSHPNIGQIHDLGEINGNYFIAMEYIAGKDLRALFDRCRKRPSPEPAPIPLTCHVIAQVCDGLDHAHRKIDAAGRPMHVVHRDVSPQNVLIGFDGIVKVIDFGIAKAAGKATRTQAGILKGKFGYMSPEQVRGQEIDRRADIFAIGICLYELLTGERLFVGETDFAVLEKVRNAAVPAPSTLNPKISPALEEIVLKALSKDLEKRYQHASELAEDLRGYLRDTEQSPSAEELSALMHTLFADEIVREAERMAEYAEIQPPPGFVIEAPPPRRSTSGNVPLPPPAAAPLGEDEDEEEGATLLIGQSAVKAALAPLGLDAEEEATSPLLPGQKALEASAAVQVSPALVPGIPVLNAVAPPEGMKTALGRTPRPSGPRSQSGSSVPAAPALDEDVSDGSDTSVTGADLTGPVGAGSTGRFGVPAPDEEQSITDPQLRPGLAKGALSPEDRTGPVPVPPYIANGARGSVLPAPRGARPRQAAPRAQSQAQAHAKKPGKRPVPLLAGVGALLLFAVVALVWAVREPATGYVLIDLPSDVRARAHLNLNGERIDEPLSWPVLRRVPAGKGMVMVSAEGYKPFVLPVTVRSGAEPTTVSATLIPLEARAKLVVETDPATAAITMDGRPVKAEGIPGLFVQSVPLNHPVALSVSAPGFEPKTIHLTPASAEAPLKELIRLRPRRIAVKVSSMPAGAEIVVNGKAVGTTPRKLHVRSDTPSVVVRKHCYQPATLALSPPAAAGVPVSLHANLERLPGCR